MSLREFLKTNEAAILATTEAKALQLAGPRPPSEQMKLGLPIFFRQLLEVLERSPPNPICSPGINGSLVYWAVRRLTAR